MGEQRKDVVVGLAVVRGGYVLAAQREYPAEHAGKWEFPGGSVEVGESEVDAAVRECREELDIGVQVLGGLGEDIALPGGKVLRLYRARLRDPAAQPRALEHRALRWVGRDELDALDWLPADRAVLDELRAHLDK